MSIVKVTLLHPASGACVQEKRLALDSTISSIKSVLERHFATPPERQKLTLKNDAGAIVETSLQDSKLLGYYQVKDDWTIEVMDLEPESTDVVDWNDVSKVEKFEISEEEYSKRDDTARAFRERCIAQQRAQMVAQGIAPPVELHEDSFKEDAVKISVGDRCQVYPGDRLGAVMYVGRVPSIKLGWWIGVQYDEPVGKNDGSAGGHQYFECPKGYGGFVRPEHVTVGDYPPEEF